MCHDQGGPEDTAEGAVETSLAENFHRLAMHPADGAQAFASLIKASASIEDVARRFGLTARFIEGRLRLAKLAPVVFEALSPSAPLQHQHVDVGNHLHSLGSGSTRTAAVCTRELDSTLPAMTTSYAALSPSAANLSR